MRAPIISQSSLLTPVRKHGNQLCAIQSIISFTMLPVIKSSRSYNSWKSNSSAVCVIALKACSKRFTFAHIQLRAAVLYTLRFNQASKLANTVLYYLPLIDTIFKPMTQPSPICNPPGALAACLHLPNHNEGSSNWRSLKWNLLKTLEVSAFFPLFHLEVKYYSNIGLQINPFERGGRSGGE